MHRFCCAIRAVLDRRSLHFVVPLACVFASLACESARSSVGVPGRTPIVDSSQGTTKNTAQSDSALTYPFVPKSSVTPGDVLPVTAADICTPGFSRRVRNVPIAVKRQAYSLYGIRTHEPGEYEVDHLISLELGGSNSIRNLWPQSFRTLPWNAYAKDELENALHRRVCAGTIDLAKAQYVISHNWVIGYRTYVHQTPPAATAHRKKRSRHARTQMQPHFQGPVP